MGSIRTFWVVFLLLLATACGGKQKQEYLIPGQTELLVDSFEIRGVESVPLNELRSGLATQETTWRSAGAVRWVPVLGDEKHYFNYVQWKQDLDRIRTFYYARGYYDARIVAENIRENPKKQSVAISITVSEGSPTKVKEIVLDGIEATEIERDRVLSSIELSEGDVLVEDEYLAARRRLRDVFAREGYAYAEVEGRVEVEPKELAARVVFFVDPGPRSKFGEVEIIGTETVPPAAVREAITFENGDRFSPEELQKTQERIYDLGVFSVVKVSVETERESDEEEPVVEESVEPAEDAGGLSGLLADAQEKATVRAKLDPNVPVTIRVKEAKLWSVRVGAGVAAEVARQDAHGRIDWTSRNFLGGLRKLEHFNSAGYAFAPSVFNSRDQRNEGVIVDSELRFTQPQFLERYTKLETRLRFQREIEPGYTQISPTARIALRRRFFRFLTAEISYNLEVSLLDVKPELLDPSLRIQPTYALEYLQQRLSYDRRNSVFNPTRGFLIEAYLQEAGSYIGRIPGNPLGGNFDYLSPAIGAEVYIPYDLWIPQVLALRARVATIYDIGERKLPPPPHRLYAGGSDSIRSFGRRQLSLYSLAGDAIPVGGLTRAEAAVEPRFRIVENLAEVGDLWFAPFFDAATVLPGPLIFQTETSLREPETASAVLDSLLYGVGAGVWWVTPVGPVRLDFAYTISDLSNDPRFRRCAVETELPGECPGDFVPLSEDPIQSYINGWNLILGIGHSF